MHKNSTALHSPSPGSPLHDTESIARLEEEIASFEKELNIAELKVRAIKSQIQARFHSEITQIHKLYTLYKSQKRQKRDKRLEQKKRGKNYKEPAGLKRTTQKESTVSSGGSDGSHELKKLYREAVVQVHPDKFVNHPALISKRSLELTIQLIDIYQSGDLNKLKQVHRHIMSGNAMAGFEEDTSKVPDPVAMKEYLVQKRDTLKSNLLNVKESYFYQIVSTSDNLDEFIENMAAQFHLRIQQLERRTRS